MSHFEKHAILTEAQHGFRSRRSCESQLIYTVHELTKGLSEEKQIDVILLDFSKAFDKVPHERLIHKLHYYGIRNNTLSWIRSFLQNRKQLVMVVLEGERSTVTDVDSGVPQGSPGPTFVPGLYQRPPGSCQFPSSNLRRRLSCISQHQQNGGHSSSTKRHVSTTTMGV